jgi:proton glutamate symport protein
MPTVAEMSGTDLILHIFPENIAKSIYEGQVLQIVVFSILFGIAVAMIKDKYKTPMIRFTESLAETMFKFTQLIMYFAPFAVFAAIAYSIGHMGLDILFNLFKLLATLYVSLIVFLLTVLCPVALLFRVPIRKFLKAVSEPVALAFATTSSESALPIAMERMEELGVPRKIVAFVMPTGYSFNLDGTTLYLSLATIFVRGETPPVSVPRSPARTAPTHAVRPPQTEPGHPTLLRRAGFSRARDAVHGQVHARRRA